MSEHSPIFGKEPDIPLEKNSIVRGIETLHEIREMIQGTSLKGYVSKDQKEYIERQTIEFRKLFETEWMSIVQPLIGKDEKNSEEDQERLEKEFFEGGWMESTESAINEKNESQKEFRKVFRETLVDIFFQLLKGALRSKGENRIEDMESFGRAIIFETLLLYARRMADTKQINPKSALKDASTIMSHQNAVSLAEWIKKNPDISTSTLWRFAMCNPTNPESALERARERIQKMQEKNP